MGGGRLGAFVSGSGKVAGSTENGNEHSGSTKRWRAGNCKLHKKDSATCMYVYLLHIYVFAISFCA